jgi:hypothetical protein
VTLSAQDLLAGGALSFEIAIPAAVLRPGGAAAASGAPDTVRIRPLTVADLQLIARAAKESDVLSATLMVQRALIEPALGIPEVASLHAGLLDFLLRKVNEVSGISMAPERIDEALEDPLVQSAFVLAREFGWTPQQVNELTLGQILLNLKMLKAQHERAARARVEHA